MALLVIEIFVNLFVYIFSALIVLRVLLSYFVQPANHFYAGVIGITEPLLDPVRKALPTTTWGYDIAPLAALVLLELVQFFAGKFLGS